MFIFESMHFWAKSVEKSYATNDIKNINKNVLQPNLTPNSVLDAHPVKATFYERPYSNSKSMCTPEIRKKKQIPHQIHGNRKPYNPRDCAQKTRSERARHPATRARPNLIEIPGSESALICNFASSANLDLPSPARPACPPCPVIHAI